MTRRDNILQELQELQSRLVNADPQNIYQVPQGYFDNLAEQVLNRIKALDAVDVSEELSYLSPLVNSVSRKTPYSVPSDFFNEQRERIMQLIHQEQTEQTTTEELQELSPLLSSLKKEMPYSVPQGYFETLNNTIGAEKVKPAAKVVSMTNQKWFRYAAAAVVVGFVTVSGILLFTKKAPIDPKTQSAEWVKKNMNKVSTDEINNFVQLADSRDMAIVDKNEVKDKTEVQELIKDIPEKDIQSFLDETQAGEPDTNEDDALMN